MTKLPAPYVHHLSQAAATLLILCFGESCCRSVQSLSAAHEIQLEPVTHQLLEELLGLPS